ncbi:urease accessory protein D isoform X2 [Diospyros lotus]|uniref:urease accessory protein D isoform X2 n=1 Tax=Diospyros lotus TaxID=55363 RepID=UPI00224DA3F2|nr:urease accessory protein D isoform X2 [Diospyros lotus]
MGGGDVLKEWRGRERERETTAEKVSTLKGFNFFRQLSRLLQIPKTIAATSERGGEREREREMETGKVVVERIRGKSTVTRCFSKYPLKFIIPNKGDSISCHLTIGDSCTTVLTTQASTKVYKSIGLKCSEQFLEARVGRNALLAVIPDPVTCFSTAKYFQKQVFTVASDSSLLIVDWITSGRHESGERWDFELYKSTNHIFLEGNQPLFLDSILLEKGSSTALDERMQGYQVLAMVILLGPKLQQVQNQVQEHVRKIMSKQLHIPSSSFGRDGNSDTDHCLTKPDFIASCSVFGPKGVGVVVRIAAMTTESVYRFLQHQFVSLESLLGASPYC